jgi:P pilus assembly chaperone PapD
MNKKNVTFSEINQLFFIESYNYKDIYTLWWSNFDNLESIKSSRKEINNLLNIHPSMNIKHAKKLLYQPNNICYDPNNFD